MDEFPKDERHTKFPPNILNHIAREQHEVCQTWWHDPKTGKRLERNKGEMLMLMVSEIAEAMEALRKDLMDDKLPHRKGVEVELSDCMLRIFDFCAAYKLDLDGAFWEKMAFNQIRADHKPENRIKPNGKQF